MLPAAEVRLQPRAEMPELAIDPLAAFMGALDDIAADAKNISDASERNQWAQRVMGVFDTASSWYDPDRAKSMELVRSLAVRLGEMACGAHGELGGALVSVKEKFGLHDKDDGHDHADKKPQDKDGHDPKKCDDCKHGRKCSRK